ncbi:MAG: hypothetical protein LBP93_00485 [Treponema sp.]|nr:hypothetical protein [Treponema sp.]
MNLGLTPKDTHPTPTGTPTAEVAAEPFLLGRHELGVSLLFETESSLPYINQVTLFGPDR